VHPLGDKSPIAGFLKKNPRGGIHHICIEVDNLDEACKTLAENDITALSPKPSVSRSSSSVECVRCMKG
jgi:methylmalonyl-CoA/ethylmalonyl-CoA epimerase